MARSKDYEPLWLQIVQYEDEFVDELGSDVQTVIDLMRDIVTSIEDRDEAQLNRSLDVWESELDEHWALRRRTTSGRSHRAVVRNDAVFFKRVRNWKSPGRPGMTNDELLEQPEEWLAPMSVSFDGWLLDDHAQPMVGVCRYCRKFYRKSRRDQRFCQPAHRANASREKIPKTGRSGSCNG